MKLKGFNLFRCDRNTGSPDNTKAGGGVCTYVNSDLTVRLLPDGMLCDENIEMLSLRVIRVNCRDLIIVSVYRPPSGICDLALHKLRSICDSVSADNKRLDIVVVGDLNIDTLTASYNKTLLLEFCNAHLGPISAKIGPIL